MKNRGRITVTRTHAELAATASEADSFPSRLQGLLGRTLFHRGDALILPSCKMVHTLFMHFPIDVVFCSKDCRVVKLVPNLKPYRFSRFVPNADFIIELPIGTIHESRVQVGDYVVIQS